MRLVSTTITPKLKLGFILFLGCLTASAQENSPFSRYGIGNIFPKGKQSDFVLGKWVKEEEPMVKLKIDKAVEVIESFSTAGVEAAMNLVNKIEFSL